MKGIMKDLAVALGVIVSCLSIFGILVAPMYFEYRLKLKAIEKGLVTREDIIGIEEEE